MPIRTRRPHIDPAHADRVVATFAAAVDLPKQEAYTRAEAQDLLARLDFDVRPGTIAEFVSKGYIEDPGDTLTCVDLYHFVAALEARRRWKPSPSRQDVKKTAFRVQLEQRRADGLDPVEDLDDYSIEDLLLQIVQCDERMTRECLYEVVRLKLGGYEE